MQITSNKLKLAVVAAACSTLFGCANVNNAQIGAAGGAVAGGFGGLLAAKILCKDNDVACRNRTIVAGAAAGGIAGYITGQEMDLKIAEEAAAELRQQGHVVEVSTRMVESDVPIDTANGSEIPNDQLQTIPKERVAMRKKQVKALSGMTVQLKNRNDAAERARVSNYLLAKANQMHGRQELTIPAEYPKSERVALMRTANQKNVLVREAKGASTISIASL